MGDFKLLLITACVSFFLNRSYCQYDTTLIGAYRNNVDFSNNKRLYSIDFRFSKAKSRKVPELYHLQEDAYSEITYEYDKSIWGIYDGNYFYLNGDRIGMVHGYIRLEKKGDYAYFIGKPVKSLEQQARITSSAVMFGFAGVFAANAAIDKENKNRVHFVLNFKTGMVNLLTGNYMLRILEPYSDLYYSFLNENDKNSIDLLKHYLDLVNLRTQKNIEIE